MKVIASNKREQNQAAVDPWTVIHFSSGLALGLIDAPFRLVIGAAVIYEVVEQYAERHEWGKDLFETSGPETLPNVLVDIAVLAIGHRLGAAWNRTRD